MTGRFGRQWSLGRVLALGVRAVGVALLLAACGWEDAPAEVGAGEPGDRDCRDIGRHECGDGLCGAAS